MHASKSVKIIFLFAALVLVAKPFLGFTLFTRIHPPQEQSIFIKAFTKRKLEYRHGSNFDMAGIQQKLADPLTEFLLSFALLLAIVFPLIFSAGCNITGRFLRRLRLSLSPQRPIHLLNGTLLI